MATVMASRDCEGQSEPIQWGDVDKRQNKIRIKSQNYASCHFYSCFAKNVCVCVFLCFPPSYRLCNSVTTVGCRCIGCTGGWNHDCLFLSFF